MSLRGVFLMLCLFASVCSPVGSSTSTTAGSGAGAHRLTRDDAEFIARLAAEKQGYDLSKYELDRFSEHLSTDPSVFTLVFYCVPSPGPGCSFKVLVYRRTGAAQLIPGERRE
jgi:hypothetical protein